MVVRKGSFIVTMDDNGDWKRGNGSLGVCERGKWRWSGRGWHGLAEVRHQSRQNGRQVSNDLEAQGNTGY